MWPFSFKTIFKFWQWPFFNSTFWHCAPPLFTFLIFDTPSLASKAFKINHFITFESSRPVGMPEFCKSQSESSKDWIEKKPTHFLHSWRNKFLGYYKNAFFFRNIFSIFSPLIENNLNKATRTRKNYVVVVLSTSSVFLFYKNQRF